MKKFFTLCLMFLVAGVLNLSAGYVLSGENVNGESWNHSSATNTFTEDENGDLVLTGVSLSGEFLVTLDQKSWFKPVYSAQLTAGVPLVFTTDDSNGNCKAATSYTNCTIKLTKLSATAVAVEIVSTDTQDVELTQLGENWSLIGDFNGWSDLELTQKSYGVYEAWIDQATVNGLVGKGFKFRVDSDWSKGEFGSTGLSYGLNQWNILQRSGGDITTFVQPTETYDKYLLTFCVEGSAAKFRIDGYKEAVPSLTRVFYESFDQNEGTGGNDGAWKDSIANGTWDSAVFDEPGWTAANGYFANKCIKLGASGKLGSATTPALGVTGNAELRFKAGAWNGDATTINITINNGGTLSVSSVTLVNNAFTDYTISISDATPESTITFSAEKANKNRFFLDEVEVYANSSELSAAGISLSGVMKDAETAYYHHTLANPTVTVTLPAGATYMDVEVDNSGYITESRKNQTSDCTIPFYNAGNYTVRVTAYGEGVYSVASKDIAIETVSSVYTFDELINKGEGATCYLNFSPTVVAHIGKYLYLEGYDMWDGIRSSALVYASLDKTYKKGDVLQGFIATVSYYKGNPQLIPLTTSLGDPYSYSEPYVYEVEAGEAWTAFAVEANVNKYVRVKNAPVTANPDAVDGVTAYTKNLGVNMPDDLTKKYDVEGFINNFNGTIQIQPISFTVLEEKIEPFTYTEIVPANNAEVTSLSEIKITFPYEVDYDATVAMGVLVMDGANMITPQVSVEGAVATLTFDAITAYGSKPSLMVMEGAFKASGVGCQQIVANWSIPTPPVRADYMPINIDPADGTVVESIKNIYFYFDDENPCVTDKGYNAPYKGYVTVKDGNGNAVASDIYLDVKKVSGQWVGLLQPKYGSSYTEPGTYVITLAEGLFSDQQYYDEDGKKGRVNPEFTITYTIKAAALAAPTVDPANGAEVENLNTITLTFAEAVTANAEAGAITLVRNSDAAYDKQEAVVTISEDGLTATLTCKPVYPSYDPKWYIGETYTMSIPEGYFVATSGAANEALSYNWKIAAAKFTYVDVTPAQGEVTELSEILIGFANRAYGNSSLPTLNLVDADGNVVTTASTARAQNANGDWYAIKATLKDKVTAPGTYTLVVPADVFKDVDFGSGTTNAAFDLTWTIAEPDPNTYNFAWNVNPAEGTVSELKTIVFTAATAGQMLMPTNEAQVANWVKVTDQNGNVYNTTAKAGTGYDVTIEGATAPGTYTVVVPKASFYDLMASMSNPNSKNFNDEIVLTYTVEAAALAAPTVSPANGAEVENLNTITLTFAEAVTANAEAGAITLVRNSDAAYDKQEAVVTISEDGLTATLTCKPVYPSYDPKWYIGETYTMSIPEGYFVATSGAANEALSYNWKIAAAKFTYVDVTPAQGEVTELSEILIGFANRAYGNSSLPTLNLVDADGNVVTTASTARAQNANGDWYAIKATLKDKVTAPGTYTLVVPADVFKDVDFGSGTTNAAFDLTWTVMEPDPNTYDLALTSDPANGATVTELKTIKISAADASVIAMPTTEAQSAGWFTIKDAEGNSYNYTANVGVGIEINIEGATALGTYTVVVPAKSFVDAMTMTAASKRYNAEMVLTYTVEAAPAVEDFTPVVTPAAGEVTALEIVNTTIALPAKFASFDKTIDDYYNEIYIQKPSNRIWSSQLGHVSVSEDGLSINIAWDFTPEVDVEHTLIIPAGYIVLENGAKNLETKVVYTVKAAEVVEDFTPVVNPTAGNVTVEQIKTTVLSFESPIASFNDSDVRYAKNSGSVWCQYAGTWAISEDKLSLTINWDFSPEVGLGYTLELPAGCIVLENGAKNLFTQVAYTVVAGPKDLAEFVVPAGINGYINYDETDVNAWAPEFPFTVSTTAYNTVAFAAELPSLPAGITAMEVIDENGEVIAILNQDGVAPLADGEIYYVKGETTKEYVDGAELKFRFRFTHLGVSETIQFSYIIAGGNITSIADVELDGNVIVRGNDIIAPQGAAIFTVSGIRVPAEGLAPGVYVVVLGNQAVKVMVK